MFIGLIFEIIGNILLFTLGGDNYTYISLIIIKAKLIMLF